MADTGFWSEFDEQGRYRLGDGGLDVVFATRGGGRFPGKLHFRHSDCVRAEMGGATGWVTGDNSPLHGIKFLLDVGEKHLQGVAIDGGRVFRLDSPEPRSTKREFLSNLRVARNLFAHARAEADTSAIDTTEVTSAVARAAIWLTPKSVAGFDASDFGELGVERLNDLLFAVQAFKAIAAKVPADQSATRDQIGNASVAFTRMLQILSPYIPLPEEAKRVENAIRKVAFPEWVVNWDYELGSDAEGDEVVWVNVFADEKAVPRSRLAREASDLTNKVRQAFNEAGVGRWPYIRMGTVLEHKAG
jgi:hypothetical protein